MEYNNPMSNVFHNKVEKLKSRKTNSRRRRLNRPSLEGCHDMWRGQWKYNGSSECIYFNWSLRHEGVLGSGGI